MLRRLLWALFAVACMLIIVDLEISFLPAPPSNGAGQQQQSQSPTKSGYFDRSFTYRLLTLTVDFINDKDKFVVASSTFVIAIFTIALVWISNRQTGLTRDALVADNRAFIFAEGIKGFYEPDKAKRLHWRFRPAWRNSGNTPTKHMIMHTECMLLDHLLPLGFDFNYETTKTGSGLIPPKVQTFGGLAPQSPNAAISPLEVAAVQKGEKFLYLMGWVKYFDVFPGTTQHITRFCWQIVPVGEPFGRDAAKIRWDWIHHFEGNCADEECDP